MTPNDKLIRAEAMDLMREVEALKRRCDALETALQFYGDETGWNEPPIQTVNHEIFGKAYQNQASKIRLDRGRIARAALNTDRSA